MNEDVLGSFFGVPATPGEPQAKGVHPSHMLPVEGMKGILIPGLGAANGLRYDQNSPSWDNETGT